MGQKLFPCLERPGYEGGFFLLPVQIAFPQLALPLVARQGAPFVRLGFGLHILAMALYGLLRRPKPLFRGWL